MDEAVKAAGTTHGRWMSQVSDGRGPASRFLRAAADYLGMSMHDLKGKLRDGDTLTAIVGAQTADNSEKTIEGLNAALQAVVPTAMQGSAADVIGKLLASPLHIGKPVTQPPEPVSPSPGDAPLVDPPSSESINVLVE